MKKVGFLSEGQRAERLPLAIALAWACIATALMLLLSGCARAGAPEEATEPAETAAVDEAPEATAVEPAAVNPLDEVGGFNEGGDWDDQIVVEGTVERLEQADGSVCYVLRRDEPTTFSMTFFGAGHHVARAVTDTVVLGTASEGGEPNISDLLFGSLVGTPTAVSGVLLVIGDEVSLEWPIPADSSRLARQVGVVPNPCGISGDPDYRLSGYHWDELETIARAMVATGNKTYGLRIADAFYINVQRQPRSWIELADGTRREMRLVSAMDEATEQNASEENVSYVGLSFVSVDGGEELRFELGGAGSGLPEGANADFLLDGGVVVP